MTRQWIRSWVQLSLLFSGVALLGACVFRTEHKVETTHKIDAHIVLDIRQINQDVTNVEDYVRGDEATSPTSFLLRAPDIQVASLDVGSLLFARAEAAVSDSDEKAALEGRKARAKEIDELLNKKQVGEDYKGYIAVLIDKKADNYEKLKKLADTENKDRRTIYIAIAQRNGGNESNLPQVEAVSAQAIREKSLKKGQMFQAPKDKDEFAKFMNSEFGKDYKDARPEQWLEKKK